MDQTAHVATVRILRDHTNVYSPVVVLKSEPPRLMPETPLEFRVAAKAKKVGTFLRRVG